MVKAKVGMRACYSKYTVKGIKTFSLALLFVLFALPVYAGQAEAKELARNFNCSVTGIAPVLMQTGMQESTSYKVTCALPAAASEEDKKNNGTLLIRCDAALCHLVKKGELSPVAP